MFLNTQTSRDVKKTLEGPGLEEGELDTSFKMATFSYFPLANNLQCKLRSPQHTSGRKAFVGRRYATPSNGILCNIQRVT